MKRVSILTLAVYVFLSACGATATPAPTQDPQHPIANYVFPTPVPLSTATRKSKPIAPITPLPSSTAFITSTPRSPTPDPAAWKEWPVIPVVDPSIRAIYKYGQTLGNDPHAFSIFGDCQSRPDAFLGVFETDQTALNKLSPELRETVLNFEGSFNRESSTAQDGTTPGALLWTQWHRGDYGCTFAETPVECELRIHRPSFVLIQIGTHFESRNTEYLRKIITQLMDAGVVPILATKADNRELDDRINRDMALLASQYDLPLWNFWAALSDIPNRGLYVMEGRELQGAIYLTDEAAQRHRMTGLEALNAVWHMATNPSR